MSARKFLIPEFGPFAGMRVITAGSLIAMPFAGTMLADFGAEVIHIERPGVGDSLRLLGPFCELEGRKVSAAWIQDARNRLSMTLTLFGDGDELRLSAITSGGSNAMFFKMNTIGEDAFLDTIANLLN